MCVVMGRGFTLAGNGGPQGGSRNGGFTGVHKKGVHVNPVTFVL